RSLARRYPGFTYVTAVREAPAAWRGETGEVAGGVDQLVHSVDKLVVYVCGGGDTVNAVREVLGKKGMGRKSGTWGRVWSACRGGCSPVRSVPHRPKPPCPSTGASSAISSGARSPTRTVWPRSPTAA